MKPRFWTVASMYPEKQAKGSFPALGIYIETSQGKFNVSVDPEDGSIQVRSIDPARGRIQALAIVPRAGNMVNIGTVKRPRSRRAKG